MTKKELLQILNNPQIADDAKVMLYVSEKTPLALASGEAKYAELKTSNGETFEAVTIYGGD